MHKCKHAIKNAFKSNLADLVPLKCPQCFTFEQVNHSRVKTIVISIIYC